MRRFIALFLLLALLIGSVKPLLAQETANPKRYAVVVGVHKYRPGQDLPPLPFAEADAAELSDVLAAGGYKVTLLTQAAARVVGKELLAPNADFIRDQLKVVLDNPFLKETDTVLVAFAGHGVQFDRFEGEKKTPRFYFCPADADIKGIETANQIGDRHHLVSLEELYAGLGASKAGVRLMFVDACRNDPTRRSDFRSVQSVTLPKLPPPPGGIAAFFSCSANQKAFESPDLKHGVFFHYVIDGLKGSADTATDKKSKDGEITLAELHEHVAGSVYDFVQEKYPGTKQVPELKGEFRNRMAILSARKAEMPPFAIAPFDAATAKRHQEAWARHLKVDVETTNSTGMKLRLIPPGEFQMGEPGPKTLQGTTTKSSRCPQHLVRITKAFYLGKHEVTVDQFRRFVDSMKYVTDVERDPSESRYSDPANSGILKFNSGFTWKKTPFPQQSNQPVIYVSARDAEAFCEWLSMTTGKRHRLPTEAEWEYSCRAGTETDFSYGGFKDDHARHSNVLDTSFEKRFWNGGGSFDDGFVFTSAVGSFAANPFGIFDMHGNVGEWCQDGWNHEFYDRFVSEMAIDPLQPPGDLPSRVNRGGSWQQLVVGAYSYNRGLDSPKCGLATIGFRIVQEP